MKQILIEIVAVVKLQIGSETLLPPPDSSSATRKQASAYVRTFPIEPAISMTAAGQALPAYEKDAAALRKRGFTIDPFFPSLKPSVAPVEAEPSLDELATAEADEAAALIEAAEAELDREQFNLAKHNFKRRQRKEG